MEATTGNGWLPMGMLDLGASSPMEPEALQAAAQKAAAPPTTTPPDVTKRLWQCTTSSSSNWTTCLQHHG